MHPFLLRNGEIHPTSDLLISPGQTGFLNGWGVFSTLRVYDGILFAFSRHYARMERDAKLLRVPFTVSAGELRRQLLKLVEANQATNATLRVAIVRNRGGLFEAAGITSDTDLVAFTADLTQWGQGVRLYYVPNARHAASPFAGTKVLSWAYNLTWYEEAHERGYDEVVLLNQHGQISECTSANIFAIFGNDVVTPPLDASGCLPGVTRALLLEQIKVPGLTIRERSLTPEELEIADQVFITSTTRNLLPVLEIENRRLSQAPQTLTVLQRAFAEYQADYAARHHASRETVTT
jgi:branched-chain amino acid aminotransferase